MKNNLIDYKIFMFIMMIECLVHFVSMVSDSTPVSFRVAIIAEMSFPLVFWLRHSRSYKNVIPSYFLGNPDSNMAVVILNTMVTLTIMFFVFSLKLQDYAIDPSMFSLSFVVWIVFSTALFCVHAYRVWSGFSSEVTEHE